MHSRLNNILNCVVKIIVFPVGINWYYPYKIINKKTTIGSGVAISEDDIFIYILTCAHVIEDFSKILVNVRNNKEKIHADVVSASFDKDIAVIKIKKSNKYKLGISKLDKNTELYLGMTVKAVGYPLALENPVITSGVLSSIKKNNLQVDTPVNPGNSGGPLVNDNYDIVGIVSSKMQDDDVANIGFCIPIGQIILVKDEIMKQRSCKIINEPKLGVTFQPTDDDILYFISRIAHFDISSGYIIKSILNNSPIANKLNIGSVITKIDDNDVDRAGYIYTQPINNRETFKIHITDYVSTKKINDRIKITGFNKNCEDNYAFIDTYIQLKDNNYNIKKLHYPFDKPDYEIIGGMIFMKLSKMHIAHAIDYASVQNAYLMTKYADHEFIDDDILVVSAILQGSYAGDSDIFDNGEIIDKINDVDVNVYPEHDTNRNILNNMRKIIYKSVKNGDNFIKISSISKKFVVLNMSKILDNEMYTSMQHKYKITPLMKKLLHDRNRVDSNMNQNIKRSPEEILQLVNIVTKQ